MTILRVALATAAAIALAHYLIPRNRVATLAYSMASGAIYLAVILLTREIGVADVMALRRRKG
jgi:hypothetical protein